MDGLVPCGVVFCGRSGRVGTGLVVFSGLVLDGRVWLGRVVISGFCGPECSGFVVISGRWGFVTCCGLVVPSGRCGLVACGLVCMTGLVTWGRVRCGLVVISGLVRCAVVCSGRVTIGLGVVTGFTGGFGLITISQFSPVRLLIHLH